MQRSAWVFAAALAIVACSKAPQEKIANAAVNEAASVANASQANEGDDRTPLAEPNGPIDPKSAEAAGQVVQSFGALIEQARWDEAEALWTSGETAMQFTSALK